jgi:sialic acid synthase SpsE
MSEVILDFGSGNSCRNDKAYIKRMYDELKAIDTGKHEIIVKWQLFEKAGENIPLTHEAFQYAYDYGTSLGYKVTASAFDKNSLDFLLGFDIPFVKIANNRGLDWLTGEIPRRVPVAISVGKEMITTSYFKFLLPHDHILYCVSSYPARDDDYTNIFGYYRLHRGISDHTTSFSLFRKFEPEVIEMHYKLEDSTGLDAGPFARTPAQLAEIL